ncbi:MAG: ATP-binding protein [Trueperaceae bacterium]
METLTLPGTLDSLAPIREFVDRAALAAGLERKAAYRLRLAVDEIATNVISYGYGEAGMRGELRLTTKMDTHTLTITLEDTGAAYDPQEALVPADLHTPLEQRSVGGLGIFLSVSGVDEFRYQREEGRNRNLFVMHRTPEAQTEGKA